MVEKDGTRLVRRTRGASETDADLVMVQFSPEVVRGLARLEAAVHDSKHFSPEILENLQEYSTGKSISVQRALTGIAFFAREAMEHVNATGDERAKEALNRFITDLMGQTDTPPVTVTKARRHGR